MASCCVQKSSRFSHNVCWCIFLVEYLRLVLKQRGHTLTSNCPASDDVVLLIWYLFAFSLFTCDCLKFEDLQQFSQKNTRKFFKLP